MSGCLPHMQYLANPHVREILLYGREGRETLLRGITQDFIDSFAARGTDIRINWTTNLKDAAGSDVVVITAGIPRSPGQDRLDLALGNAQVITPLAQTIGVIAPETKILVVTNPVDVMTCVALKYSGLKPNQVFGLGTHLDSMRLKSLIAAYFKVHVSEVHTRIIGEHGDEYGAALVSDNNRGYQDLQSPCICTPPGKRDHRIRKMQRGI